jgi:hypothetical protein
MREYIEDDDSISLNRLAILMEYESGKESEAQITVLNIQRSPSFKRRLKIGHGSVGRNAHSKSFWRGHKLRCFWNYSKTAI